MIDTAILMLVRTTIPEGLWFNSCGVAMKVLAYSWTKSSFHYTIEVCSINGLWAFGVTCGCNYKGFGSGIWQGSFRYGSFEECLRNAISAVSKFFKDDNIKLSYPSSLDGFKVNCRAYRK